VHQRKEGVAPAIHEGWLVTNTKLTSKAKQYGRCSGLKLIGWNYPKHDNLQDMILRSGVHPISALTTVSPKRKRHIFERGIILCRELVKHKNVLRELGMSEKSIEGVMGEIALMCGGGIAKEIGEK